MTRSNACLSIPLEKTPLGENDRSFHHPTEQLQHVNYRLTFHRQGWSEYLLKFDPNLFCNVRIETIQFHFALS